MDVVCLLLQLYSWVIIIGALLSWFPSQPGGGVDQLRLVIGRATDPVIVPVRRALGAGVAGIDFSPLVVLIGIWVLMSIIC